MIPGVKSSKQKKTSNDIHLGIGSWVLVAPSMGNCFVPVSSGIALCAWFSSEEGRKSTD
jgi:hypothetical protein